MGWSAADAASRKVTPWLAGLAALIASAFAVTPVLAQPEKCPRMVAEAPPRIIPAAFRLAAAGTGEVRLTFVGHATFLIESPAGVTIATDYNDYVRPSIVPMVVTMNRAHDTHYTNNPDPGIAHVLRGWNPEGGAANHELTLEDVWIRNVPTNIRQGAATLYDGNSIFVFEVAGVCIAHLGHLHHVLTPDHLEAMGRIDVVLAPVDGSYTLDIDGMLETLKAINAPLVIPMHYFSSWGLDRFLNRLSEDYAVTRSASPTITLSRETLPARPTILVLPGR
ncbi:MBL fold metallo-hydrolase [Aquabacter sp. L1I39]|uniref:MBL fold metallo-hydrolase n=1 Tax=Aquabacter sp. L1I39 TaxID=2820278 RepID=UPI001ADD0FE2|nr:MBL fold metallo-hydrolase [Aquabacter sp. L1I39]QTL03040.1 MBL fold metallo-hydrolase [Aquabacter sp. L1I39]